MRIIFHDLFNCRRTPATLASRQMERFKTLWDQGERVAPTLALVAVVLLAAWMGNARGGYFLEDWAPVTFFLAVLTVVASVAGVFRGAISRWSLTAIGLFVAYVTWTFASLLWSPNRADA